MTVIAGLLAAAEVAAAGSGLPETAPDKLGMDAAWLDRIDTVVGQGIEAGNFPGAVVLIGRHGQVVFQRAYGDRSVKPRRAAMTSEALFDIASLTKVVATAPAIMQLVEAGRLRLESRLDELIPDCNRDDKRAITVQNLLEHDSGLRAGFETGVLNRIHGYDDGVRLACQSQPFAKPGREFRYSDLNYVLLGEVVRRVSGERLDDYAARNIFPLLGMDDTYFNPPAGVHGRIAATDVVIGQVEDGIARRMDGVSGHSGLYSTAGNLAAYCAMLLNGGEWNGRRVLSPLGVRRMTMPATGHKDGIRGLGFDIDTAYSGSRGDLFPFGSFGHTGYSGTSLWLDPMTDVFVVILTNRLHPDGRGEVRELRSEVANIAAAAIRDVKLAGPASDVPGGSSGTAAPAEPVLAGIDVLRAGGFKSLRGRRVGLLTQRTSVAADGATTIDLLRSAPGVKLIALFSPEHGLDGGGGDNIPSTRDAATGLPVYSLYGGTLRPAPEMLRDIDTLVIDLQDAGARFYTYLTTMAYAMEEAAKRHVAIVVLDRPNPITGARIEGPQPDEGEPAFTNYFPMPVRHGLTMGELARLFNAENRIGANLTVVPMRGWRRGMWFDETGLRWFNPSPNMRKVIQAILYPGLGGIEGTRISVGRGTDSPFEQLGSPWIDGRTLAQYLNDRRLPGVRFYPVTFTPTVGPYQDEFCQGIGVLVTDREALRPVYMGVEIAAALNHLYGEDYQLAKQKSLFGSKQALERVLAGDKPARIVDHFRDDENRWQQLRAKYLLYQ